MRLSVKSKFLISNLLKGLGILALVIISYVALQKYTDLDAFLEYVGQWPALVYLSFILSEIIFGLIPPELYMIWSIKNGIIRNYYLDIALLAVVSYAAGIFGYFAGSYLKRKWPVFFEKNILKYKKTLNRFGGLLIFVGAVTPIPFSAICMLVGSTNYRFSRFLIIASARFVRFAVYGFTIYQFNI